MRNFAQYEIVIDPSQELSLDSLLNEPPPLAPITLPSLGCNKTCPVTAVGLAGQFQLNQDFQLGMVQEMPLLDNFYENEKVRQARRAREQANKARSRVKRTPLSLEPRRGSGLSSASESGGASSADSTLNAGSVDSAFEGTTVNEHHDKETPEEIEAREMQEDKERQTAEGERQREEAELYRRQMDEEQKSLKEDAERQRQEEKERRARDNEDKVKREAEARANVEKKEQMAEKERITKEADEERRRNEEQARQTEQEKSHRPKEDRARQAEEEEESTAKGNDHKQDQHEARTVAQTEPEAEGKRKQGEAAKAGNSDGETTSDTLPEEQTERSKAEVAKTEAAKAHAECSITESCKDVFLERKHMLKAQCKTRDGRWVPDVLNMNTLISFDGQKLNWGGGGGFLRHARRAWGGPTSISAECRVGRRWQVLTLDNVSEHILNDNGRLVFSQEPIKWNEWTGWPQQIVNTVANVTHSLRDRFF